MLATVSYALIAGVGLWIIVHRDMGMREGVYLCGLTMGISIVLQNIMFMYLDSDDVTFFLELGSLVLGILLIFFAAGFLFGYDISSTRLTVTVAIQILVIIAPMFIDWFIKVVPTLTVIGEYYVQFPACSSCSGCTDSSSPGTASDTRL